MRFTPVPGGVLGKLKPCGRSVHPEFGAARPRRSGITGERCRARFHSCVTPFIPMQMQIYRFMAYLNRMTGFALQAQQEARAMLTRRLLLTGGAAGLTVSFVLPERPAAAAPAGSFLV